MCGRYSFASDAEVLTKIFKLKSAPSMAPRYNISPSQKCAVILKIKDGERYMSSMRWGLVPRWSKGPNNQFSMFNARSETAHTKPAFRESFKNRHCLIPADGYYEWKTNATEKQAYRIITKEKSAFAFAGLWDSWKGYCTQVYSFTILTLQSCPEVSGIHHRMPIIVRRKYYNDWLTAKNTDNCISDNDGPNLKALKVSNKINDPRNENPDVWLP